MKNPTNFIIIDDGRISALITEIAINDAFENATIKTFTHPLDGVEFIKNKLPLNPVNTVLFLDINMPMVDGWEVVERIEKLPPSTTRHLAIYMLSSSLDPADKLKAKELVSVTDYLDKPLSTDTLQAAFL